MVVTKQLTGNCVSIAMAASTFADGLNIGGCTAQAIELSFKKLCGFHFV
jgi:hypothetical protein